jgi:hypothetical protein
LVWMLKSRVLSKLTHLAGRPDGVFATSIQGGL